METVSRCVAESAERIGLVLCGFHIEPLSYCASLETKGWPRGGPRCHMGVYRNRVTLYTVLYHAMYRAVSLHFTT